MKPNDQVQIHVIIEGRVQGVGFRYFVLEKAYELGVKGWVRNTYNGEVEVLAEGSNKQIEKFLGLIRQGPSLASITKIDIQRNVASGEYIDFSLRLTV
jgi:acylphosphatase